MHVCDNNRALGDYRFARKKINLAGAHHVFIIAKNFLSVVVLIRGYSFLSFPYIFSSQN